MAAWKAGQQLTLQPTFAKSDRGFRRQETLSSAIVASDRSGNERAGRLCKLSGYISRGLDNNQSFERMHKVWLCWGFQLTFMFSVQFYKVITIDASFMILRVFCVCCTLHVKKKSSFRRILKKKKSNQSTEKNGDK